MASTWLTWGFFRWEPISLGMNFEGGSTTTVGTGACWDIAGGFYLRSLLDFAFVDGNKYWGVLGGVGYSFDLGNGWSLDAEVDATLWPGDVLAVPVEGRAGVRYGF